MLRILKSNLNTLRKQSSFYFAQKIGVPKETFANEKRISVSPEGVTKLKKLGYDVIVEKNGGVESDFTNESYEASGAIITNNPYDCDILLKVRAPNKEEIKKLKPNTTLISFLNPG